MNITRWAFLAARAAALGVALTPSPASAPIRFDPSGTPAGLFGPSAATEPANTPFRDPVYSQRRATTGSTRIARRAGT